MWILMTIKQWIVYDGSLVARTYLEGIPQRRRQQTSEIMTVTSTPYAHHIISGHHGVQL